MSTFRDWEAYKRLKNRADTNSVVDVLKNKSTGDLIVRKIIYGIEQPLYQAVFTREMRALYKLNKCSNIVNILGDDYLVISTTKEKVGVIYLEYINGIELGKSSIENFSAKERFSIIKQLLDAIEISHSNGIIHRDINPNNIMLTDDKQVKLIDFGICKINDMINSATVYKLGTNAYSAPEVHQHSEIIAGTCTGFVSNRIIRDVEFDYVIVDEAAKATFPELAVSLNKAHKIILVE